MSGISWSYQDDPRMLPVPAGYTRPGPSSRTTVSETSSFHDKIDLDFLNKKITGIREDRFKKNIESLLTDDIFCFPNIVLIIRCIYEYFTKNTHKVDIADHLSPKWVKTFKPIKENCLTKLRDKIIDTNNRSSFERVLLDLYINDKEKRDALNQQYSPLHSHKSMISLSYALYDLIDQSKNNLQVLKKRLNVKSSNYAEKTAKDMLKKMLTKSMTINENFKQKLDLYIKEKYFPNMVTDHGDEIRALQALGDLDSNDYRRIRDEFVFSVVISPSEEMIS